MKRFVLPLLLAIAVPCFGSDSKPVEKPKLQEPVIVKTDMPQDLSAAWAAFQAANEGLTHATAEAAAAQAAVESANKRLEAAQAAKAAAVGNRAASWKKWSEVQDKYKPVVVEEPAVEKPAQPITPPPAELPPPKPPAAKGSLTVIMLPEGDPQKCPSCDKIRTEVLPRVADLGVKVVSTRSSEAWASYGDTTLVPRWLLIVDGKTSKHVGFLDAGQVREALAKGVLPPTDPTLLSK